MRLAEARSEGRRLVDVADREPARAGSGARQFGRDGRVGAITRFRDYLRGRPNESEELAAIRNSAFFDAEFYLNSNPDVGASGMDAALHYLAHGAREGRDPGPRFSTRDYLVQFPDVAASGLNPLAHYEMFGRREKRRIPSSQP